MNDRYGVAAIPIPRPDGLSYEFSFFIDDKGGRNSFDAKKVKGTAARVKKNWKGVTVLLNKFFNQVMPPVIKGNSQKDKPLPLKSLVYGFQRWHLLSTGTTPGGPEIEKNKLSATILQRDISPRKTFQTEIRGKRLLLKLYDPHFHEGIIPPCSDAETEKEQE